MKKKNFNKNIEHWFSEIKESDLENNLRITHSYNTPKKTIVFSFTVFDRRLVWTRGTSNKTSDFFYIPYFDYDGQRQKYIVEELKVLQEQFDLGDIALFKSSKKNHYQAIGFSKLCLSEFQNVLMHSSCDYAFVTFPKYLPYAKYYVLRHFAKGNTNAPKFIKMLKAKTQRKQSTAHHKFLSLLYPEINKYPLIFPDNLQRLTVIDYPTGINV